MLRHSVAKLIEWVGETTGETDMAYALSCYLMAQGERTFDDAAMEMGRETRERWHNLIEETIHKAGGPIHYPQHPFRGIAIYPENCRETKQGRVAAGLLSAIKIS